MMSTQESANFLSPTLGSSSSIILWAHVLAIMLSRLQVSHCVQDVVGFMVALEHVLCGPTAD
jgi:hypothetical protein